MSFLKINYFDTIFIFVYPKVNKTCTSIVKNIFSLCLYMESGYKKNLFIPTKLFFDLYKKSKKKEKKKTQHSKND